jgi:hypothetical protein
MTNYDFIHQFSKQNAITNHAVDLVNLHNAFHIKWNGSIADFLDMVHKNGVKHIFTDIFSPNYQIIESKVKELEIEEDNPKYEEVKDLLSKIKAFDGMEMITKVLITLEGNKIIFEDYSDHSDAFFMLHDEFERIEEAVKEDSQRKPELEFDMRREEIKPFAMQLAQHPEFESTLFNSTELDILLDHILKDKDWLPAKFTENRSRMAVYMKLNIKDIAKAYFKTVIEPELNKKRIDQIKAWRAQKMTKVEMASKLGISKDKLNQLYYQAT